MSCGTCEYLFEELKAAKTYRVKRKLGSLLDLHLETRHPELLRELKDLEPCAATART